MKIELLIYCTVTICFVFNLLLPYYFRFAFVEFADQASVPLALQYNGAMLGDRPIKYVYKPY